MFSLLGATSGEDDKRAHRVGKEGTDGDTRPAIYFNTMHAQHAERIVMVGMNDAVDFVKRGGGVHGITGCYVQ